MAVIDRVKERVETDLGDSELSSLIAEAQQAIRDRWGPDRDPENPITVTVDGVRRALDMARPIDTAADVVVVEHATSVTGDTPTELASDDYRVRYGGRTVERLTTGTNPRSSWGHRVDITYVPVDDQARRDEATIKLVKLTITYAAAKSVRVGDVSTTHDDFVEQSNAIIAALSPRPGLGLA